MRRPLNLALIEREIRRSVCADCPYRSTDSDIHNLAHPDCEKACPIFQELPALLCAAEKLDPLVANYDTAVADLVRHRCEISACAHRSAHDSPLLRHRRRIGRVIKDSLVP
jgi:hypothetical protein